MISYDIIGYDIISYHILLGAGPQCRLPLVHKIIMRSARGAIGNYCCRFSIAKILNICKWSTAKNMITHSAITTIHNILTKKKPLSIIKLFNINNQRQSKQITTKYLPRTETFKKFYIYNTINIYNEIPSNIKSKSKVLFKKLSKKWLASYSPNVIDTMD